jgi:hypothetical protein
LSLISKDLFWNPISNSFMQTSLSCFVHNVLLKIPLILENLFYYWLRILCSLFKNFWKKFDLIWSIFAKDTKEIKETENEKELEQKKEERDSGNPSAQIRKGAHGPSSLSRNGTPEHLFPSPTGGPLLSVVFLLRPLLLTANRRVDFDLHSPLLPCPFYHTPTPINTLVPPSPSPFASPRVHRLAAVESLDGAPQTCRGLRPNSPSPVSPAPSLLSYHLCIALPHPPDPLYWFESPQIDASGAPPKPPQRRRTPAASLSLSWKLSTT